MNNKQKTDDAPNLRDADTCNNCKSRTPFYDHNGEPSFDISCDKYPKMHLDYHNICDDHERQIDDKRYTVYCSSCGGEFNHNVKTGFSHCEDHKDISND